jgi:hypothetical protein
MVLTMARLPVKMAASDLADDPAGEHLYVSAAHMVRGGMEGNVVLEYDARSGRLLAEANHGLVTYSVAGSALTAVPGGVWVSFRTGMLGLTLHLRQPDLATVAPPGPNIAQSPATSLFHWAMYAATSYGGGALWLANQVGIVACLDPRTGKPRAIERLSQGQLIFKLLAADPASGQVYASDNRGLVAITPPPKCWQREPPIPSSALASSSSAPIVAGGPQRGGGGAVAESLIASPSTARRQSIPFCSGRCAPITIGRPRILRVRSRSPRAAVPRLRPRTA